MTEFIFFFSLFIVFYTYVGYAGLIYILLSIRKLFPRKSAPEAVADFHPEVTLIVAAFNEEDSILSKIQNSLALAYPAGNLHFLFITDGSDDLTAGIIRRYEQIQLLHQDERKGKVAAINRAMTYVKTPYVIFSDANTLLNPDCVRQIMKHYADPSTGGVAGEKKVTGGQSGTASEAGEGLYWKYESILKKLDAEFYTVVGAAGELFSLRTTLYQVVPENTIIEDFVQSMLICLAGYKVKYEPRAYATETGSVSMQEEHKRKIRISAGAFQAMGLLRAVFNPRKYPVLLFQYVSHRLFRWTLCPICLILLFGSNLLLIYEHATAFYYVFFYAQAVFYAAAFIGLFFASRSMRVEALYIPYYFVFMNFSVFTGFWRFIRKSQSAIWEKSVRQPA